MKVAFFVGKFPVLSETFVIRTIVGLKKLGHEVTVIAGEWGNRDLDNKTYKEFELEKITKVVRENAVGRQNRIRIIMAFLISACINHRKWKQLAAALRALFSGSTAAFLDIAAQSPRGEIGEYDAIIAHFGFCGVRVMYLQEAGLLQGKFATFFHGLDVSHRDVLLKNMTNYQRLFQHSGMLLPVSKYFAAQLIQFGAPETKIRVLPMGVETDHISHLPFGRPTHSPLRVLTVGRLTEKKGIEYAINGVGLVRHPIELTIIGGGPREKQLRSLAKETCLHPVTFMGEQPPHRVVSALSDADVFLLPSVTAGTGDTEGCPVAIQEAMAMGLLVIATRHGGIPDLIEDGVSGFLVSERSPEEIANVLQQICEGKVDRENLRQAARTTIEQNFSASKLDLQLQSICEQLKSK